MGRGTKTSPFPQFLHSQGLMKVMGLSDWMQWASWFATSYMTMALSAVCAAICWKVAQLTGANLPHPQ